MKLERRYVEKPWGRTQLPPMFDAPHGMRVGEVWFTGGGDLPLLAKYIFTSEALSVQVHPNDEQARARGLRNGKSECWYILGAEPGSTIALGLKHEMEGDALKGAALDGSIEQLLDWKEVHGGDFIFVPAGTVHAIGGGLSLLEFQQNSDTTFRLYDYGRPRELHVDDAVSVARREPIPNALTSHPAGTDAKLLDGPHFTLVQTRRDALQDRQRWVLPIRGEVRSGTDTAGPGECLLLSAGELLEADEALMLIGAAA